jgi:nitroreductase
METLEAIYNRRSIRKYEAKAVEEDKINKLLHAAMYAPSANNRQPWHFVVVAQREMLDAIKAVHPYAGMLATATLAILVCGDKSIEPTVDYLNTNCSAATQNLLLAAHDLGLGSVWLGVYPREARIESLVSLFKLPAHIVPISLVALGYAAETKEQPERFIPERVHYEKW